MTFLFDCVVYNTVSYNMITQKSLVLTGLYVNLEANNMTIKKFLCFYSLFRQLRSSIDQGRGSDDIIGQCRVPLKVRGHYYLLLLLYSYNASYFRVRNLLKGTNKVILNNLK